MVITVMVPLFAVLNNWQSKLVVNKMEKFAVLMKRVLAVQE